MMKRLNKEQEIEFQEQKDNLVKEIKEMIAKREMKLKILEENKGTILVQ